MLASYRCYAIFSNMNDITEIPRKLRQEEICAQIESDNETTERTRLEGLYGKGNVWNTSELSARFVVVGFMAPFCVVQDKQTGVKGTVEFQHSPRFYFGYLPDKG